MAKSRFEREPFDRNREFVVTGKLTIEGKKLRSGPLDKNLFSHRRLKQLYEQRKIDYFDGTYSPVTGTFKPDFAAMGLIDLRKWLADRGVIARHTADLDALVKRAEKIFEASPAEPSAPAVANGVNP